MEPSRPLPWLLLVLLSALIMLASMVITVGAGKRRCSLDDYRAGAPKQGFICGAHIPRTLSLVCGGSYRSPGKRNYDLPPPDKHEPHWYHLNLDGEAMENDDLARDDNKELDPASWDSEVFLSKNSASSLLRNKREERFGVYCECCVHRCTYTEMTSYCGTEKRKRRDLSGLLPLLSDLPQNTEKSDLQKASPDIL